MYNKKFRFLAVLAVLAMAFAGVAVVNDSDVAVAGNEEAQIAGGQSYATLADAVSAATSGQTVELLKNVTLDSVIVINKNLTVDLKEKKISTTNCRAFTVNNGSFTVENGSISATGNDAISVSVFGTNNVVTLTVDAVSLESSTDCCIFFRGVAQNGDNTGKVTINCNDSTMSSHGRYATIQGNGTDKNVSMTLTDCIVLNDYEDNQVPDGHAIYWPNMGSLTISGGAVTGSTVGIEIRAGSITIDDDAEITGGSGQPTCSPNGNGTTTTNTALAIVEHTTEKPITATIKSGIFTAGCAVWQNNAQSVPTSPSTTISGGNFTSSYDGFDSVEMDVGEISVTGGTYNKELDASYVADGYFVYQKSADVYSVYKSGNNVRLGETNFYRMYDAVMAANSGDTITVLQDHEAYGPGIYKNLTIDFNNHTVTLEEEDYIYIGENANVIYKNGTLQNGYTFIGYSATLTIQASMSITSTETPIVIIGKGTYGEVGCLTPTLNVYGSVVTSAEDSAISTNGKDLSRPVINIYDGAVVQSNDIGIYLPSGVFTMTGGTVTAKTAIYFKASDLNISGGSINGNGPYAPYVYYGNGAYPTGDALVIDNCGYPAGIGTISITGGSFTSENAAVVGSYAYGKQGGVDREPITGFITGGFFNSEPNSAYVAQGCTVYETSAGVFVVGSPCTVTYDTQGGSAVPSKTVSFYEPATVPAENPTMEGKQFGGWYTTASCDVEYDFSLPVTNDVTIYAGWTDAPKPTYTVAFESNGGTAVKSQVVEEGKTVIRPNDPAKDGSRFNGWYTTSELTEKYVFSTPVESNMVLYAGWIATCTLSIPAAAEGCHYTIDPAQSVADIDADHLETVTVTVEAGYEGKLYINGVEQPGLTYAMTGVEQNISVSVKITEASGKTTESTQEITENDDGSVTDMNTVIETEGTTKTITEEASTTKDAVETERAKTVAEVTGSGATVAIETDSDEAKVTESMAQAIIDAVEAGSAVAIDVSTPAVSVPANLFSNELGAKVDSVTVAVNQDAAAHSATITIPKGAIETGTESISISVTPSQKQADAAALNGSSAVAAFDLTISNAASGTTFAKPVTVTYDVDLPAGAINVRFYCIDDGSFADRTVYANGVATGTLGHFSAWTIVYDMPADAGVEGDELPPIWQYVPQQQSSSSNTTMIVAACAAAVAAIAVALVMLNVVRKN